MSCFAPAYREEQFFYFPILQRSFSGVFWYIVYLNQVDLHNFFTVNNLFYFS